MRKKIAVGVISFIGIIIVGLIVLLARIAPIQLKRQVFDCQINQPISTTPETYINASEQVLKECQIIIDQVDPTIIAVYPAYVQYQGKLYSFQISIKDTKVPDIKLKDSSSVIECFIGSTYRAADLVEVKDDSKTEIYFADSKGNKLGEELTFTEKGNFEYYIFAVDTSNNPSKVRIRFEVDMDASKPTLSGVLPKTLMVGDAFDPMEGVKAIDNADGDITDRISIDGSVDTNVVGQYTLTYSVTDSSGNIAYQTRLITVTETGISGQVDVGDGPFLSSEQIELRDQIVQTLLDNQLDIFDDSSFVKQLNHYLVNNFEPSKNVNDKSSYSVIVKQRGDRFAMARAVKVFLDARDIENVIVKGDNEGMVWNIVKVNGVYRHLDVYANAIGANEYICLLAKTSELDRAYSYDTSKYPYCD